MHSRVISYLLLLVCILSLSTSLIAETVAPPPSPLSLKPDWWKAFIANNNEKLEEGVQTFLLSLQRIEGQIPEKNRSFAKSAIEKVSQNVEVFLQLNSIRGWQIEEAPTLKEVYSIDALLEITKQAKQDQEELFRSEDKLKKLRSILEQSHTRKESLYVEYLETPERSLQRTLAGLKFMIAATSHAVLGEKIRLAQEKLSGVEQRAEWNRKLLEEASERLSPLSLDPDALESEIKDSKVQEQNFQKEILQVEAEILSNGVKDYIDNSSLLAIGKIIAYSRSQVHVITARAKKGLYVLSKEEISSNQAEVLVDNSQEALQQLQRISSRVKEWRALIRRDQKAMEGFLPKETGENSEEYANYIAYQQILQKTLASVDALELELYQARVLTRLVLGQATQNLHWFTGIGQRIYYFFENLLIDTFDWLYYPLFRVNEQAITLFKILQAFAILCIAYGVSLLWAKMLTGVSKQKKRISNASLYAFNRVARYVILLIGFVWALSSVGIDFSNLLIIAGALSVGIGFGLQGIVNNFLGGLIILFDRKLRVGDFIELSGGEKGHMTEVNVQNTVIRTLNGQDILVPNSDIITRQLTNWTLRDQFARFHIPFGVAYGTDKDLVRSVVEEACRKVEETVTEHKTFADPKVWLVGFGDSALNFELVVWVDYRRSKKRQTSLRAAYYWEIESALTESGIVIPFPQRDIYIKSGGEPIKK